MRSVVGLLLLCAATLSSAQWNSWGNGLANMRYTPLKCLDKKRLLTGLKAKWTLKIGTTAVPTPTHCNGYVYTVDWQTNLYKIDSNSGRVIWKVPMNKYAPKNGVRTSPVFNQACSALFLFTQWGAEGSRLLAINTANGALIYNRVVDPQPKARCTMSPTYYNGNIYVGMSSSTEGLSDKPVMRGDFMKIQAKDGKILWRTYTTPNGYTGAPMWGSSPVVDVQRNQVCTGTGNNYSLPPNVAQCVKSKGATNWAGQRSCSDRSNFADALVCFDLKTGKVKWARGYHGIDVYGFITNYQGLDYDFAQGPILVGEILLAISKSGEPLALNATNGQAVWGPLKLANTVEGHSLFGSCSNGKIFAVGLFWYKVKRGVVAALNVRTGAVLWRWETNKGGIYGPLTCTDGVVFAPQFDTAGTLNALDATNGKWLGGYATGKTLFSGPSIVRGVAFMANGYSANGGQPGDTLHAVQLPLNGVC